MYNQKAYFIPEYNAIVSVKSDDGQFAVIGGLAVFYSDAFTNVIRHKIKSSELANWTEIDESKLESYTFLTNKNSIKSIGTHLSKRLDYQDRNVSFSKSSIPLSTWLERGNDYGWMQ